MALIIEPLSLTVFGFDVTLEEKHSHSVEWTEFPVESGLAVSDHAIDKPAEFVVSGVVSDYPMNGVLEPNRSQRAFDKLLGLLEGHRLVTVVSGLKVYSNMGLLAVNAAKDAQSGASVEPEVSLRQVRIVQSMSIEIPVDILAPKVVGAASPVLHNQVRGYDFLSPSDPNSMRYRLPPEELAQTALPPVG